MNKKDDLTFKILILGDSNVGKTSLLLKFTDNIFKETHITTIGVEYKEKEITLDNKNYKLNIWDTAGQERFKSITKSFFKSADGIIFVYDITKKSTFDNLKNWLIEAENKTNNYKSIIVGNKIDLEKIREVTYDLGYNLANKKNCLFLETSAKINIKVEDVFIDLLKEIIKNRKEKKKENINQSNFNLNNAKKETNKKKKCC